MLNTSEKKPEKNEKKVKNSKFLSNFERISVLFKQRKKENKKTYFQKITLSMGALMVGLSLMAMILYTNILQVTTSEKSYLLLYIPLIVTCAGSLFLFQIKLFYKITYVSIPLIIIGYTIYYFFGVHTVMGSIQTTIWYIPGIMIIGVGVGLLLSVAIVCFLFVMSNTERLMATLLITMAITSYRLFMVIGVNIAINYIIPIICCICSFFLIFISKKEKPIELTLGEEEATPKPSIVFLLVMFFVIMVNNGTMRYIVYNFGVGGVHFSNLSDLSIPFYIGFIVSSLLSVVVFAFASQSIFSLSNFYLGHSYLGYLLTMFAAIFKKEAFFLLLDYFFGVSCSIGIVALIMLLGKIFETTINKKAYYVTVCCSMAILLFSVGYLVFLRTINSLVITAIFLVILFILIVVYVYFNFYNRFVDSSINVSPVSYIENNKDNYKKINPEEVLTPKEKEIFALLLEGYTLRQIAGELSMKYDAVNFHYKNVYRKLEVNSKIELLMRYSKH